MNHPWPDDLDQLASEYVLGTLSGRRRRQVQEELQRNPDLQAAIRYWEERLLPLTALVEPIEPSPGLWPRIARSLSPSHASQTMRDDGFIHWWNNLKLWRSLAAAGFAAASVMAFMIAMAPQIQPAPRFMVVLAAPENMAPGWIMQADNAQRLRLIPLQTTDVPQQKSLQLWTKGEGWKGPVSLGLVSPGQPLSVNLEQLPPLQPNQLFEITLEPYQGSPVDRPTGPILYIGRTVKLS